MSFNLKGLKAVNQKSRIYRYDSNIEVTFQREESKRCFNDSAARPAAGAVLVYN
jgi:hypothetical protein